MKKVVLGVIAGSMMFAGVSFAQAPAKPAQGQAKPVQAQLPGQAEFSALMKKQGEARKALNDQLLAERDAFLKNYPELAARIAEQEKAAKERAEKKRAEAAAAAAATPAKK